MYKNYVARCDGIVECEDIFVPLASESVGGLSVVEPFLCLLTLLTSLFERISSCPCLSYLIIVKNARLSLTLFLSPPVGSLWAWFRSRLSYASQLHLVWCGCGVSLEVFDWC